MIEKIKDYFIDKYYDYITNREFNQKDPHYLGEVSEEIAARLYLFFSERLSGKSVNEDLCELEKLNERILHRDYKIYSLRNTVDVLSALQDLVTEPTTILFTTACDLRSSLGEVQVVLISSEDYSDSYTIRLLELSGNNEIISTDVISAYSIKEELKRIKKKYHKNRNMLS